MSESVTSVPPSHRPTQTPAPTEVGEPWAARSGEADLPSKVVTGEARTRCWWLGAHGGAGESTLAHLFAGVNAAEHHWLVHPEMRTAIVLVARTSFRGVTAVQAAMRDWSATYRAHVDVLGLVLIADRPGKLPRPLLDLQRTLVGATPNLWRLPWVERWTLGEIPSRENAPKKEVEALRLGLTAALRTARKEGQDG